MKIIRFESRRGAERIINGGNTICKTDWSKEAASSNRGFCFFGKKSFFFVEDYARIGAFLQDLSKELGRDLEYAIVAECDESKLHRAHGTYSTFIELNDAADEVLEYGLEDWSELTNVSVIDTNELNPRSLVVELLK